MVLFPCVRAADNAVVFRALTFSTSEVDGVRYMTFPDTDGEQTCFPIRIDVRLTQDKDSVSSALNACSAGKELNGYITCNAQEGEMITGASFGLAMAVELSQPGRFPNIAFTGLVSNLGRDDCTFRIHNIDNVVLKLRGALSQLVPLVVPFSEEVKEFMETTPLMTPRKITTHEREEVQGLFQCGTAYSLVEAILVAPFLTPGKTGGKRVAQLLEAGTGGKSAKRARR